MTSKNSKTAIIDSNCSMCYQNWCALFWIFVDGIVDAYGICYHSQTSAKYDVFIYIYTYSYPWFQMCHFYLLNPKVG